MSIPELMDAIVLQPEGNLKLENIPTPQPKQREVLLRVIACGVCHSDLHVIHGAVTFPKPCVLGHEMSGVVVALGEGSESSGLKLGDIVIGAFIMPCETCSFCLEGDDDLCEQFFSQNRLNGVLYDGTSRLSYTDGTTISMYSMSAMAEYAVAPVGALTKLPAGVDPVDAAVLGCAVFTAYGAVNRTAKIQQGDTVAVIGCGGVGSSIIQLCGVERAETIIAIDIAQEKLDHARKLGATHTVNSLEQDALQSIEDITRGAGVNVVFEAIGKPSSIELGMALLADGGRLIAVGLADGDAVAQVPITRTVRRGLSLVGSYGAKTRADLPAVATLPLETAFKLTESVTKHYSLKDAALAFEDLRTGAIQGRAVLRITSPH